MSEAEKFVFAMGEQSEEAPEKLAWHTPSAEIKAIEVAEHTSGTHFVMNDGVGNGCLS